MCWDITMHNYCAHCFQGMGHISLGVRACPEVEAGEACRMGLRKAESANTRHCCVDCAARQRKEGGEGGASDGDGGGEGRGSLEVLAECEVAPLRVRPREEEVVVVKKETKKKETGLRRWSRRLSSGFWRK